MSYLPIEHHGIIGDLHTAALVGMDGTIDWLCLPYFDSPSIFASILDDAKGGHFRITSASEEARRRQMYLPDSNILMTRFLTPDGVGEVVDFMPIHRRAGRKQGEDHQVIRIVRGVRGSLPFRLECIPAFDYARQEARITAVPGGFRMESPSCTVQLSASMSGCRIENGGVVCDFVLKEGDEIPVVLAQAGSGPPVPPEKLAERCGEEFRETLRYWQSWIAGSRYHGRWREMVKRACMVLKLMTFAPTGAIVAAPTTSLPERVGGPRNWDYRYTWIRDAAFTVYAFLRVGLTEEADHFMSFLETRCREIDPQVGLQVLYGIDGRCQVAEVHLDHLEGYRGSRPVRIGNDAAHQFQLDITGDLMDAVFLYDRYVRPLSFDLWGNMSGLADWVCHHWREPDEGIWEVRGGKHQFTFSKLMSWVALDRALRIADHRGLPAARDHWGANRDEIYRTIMTRGYSQKKQSFVQSLDSEVLDASVLLAPLVRFLSPSDPRMLTTLDAISRELVSDNLVHRYDPRVSPDGIGGEEGTFSMCTFWLAEALARAGRVEEARLAFEKMLGYANHLGLYSEEIGLTGEALGNFPQAFTHLGLISAAVNINRVLEGAPAGVETDFPHPGMA
jgi:GH15 family glucan-1,4-alpha-glucosidase